MQPPVPQRLAKWIANSGHCSRRAAEKLISERRVQVNGQFACHTAQVSSADTILIDNTPLAGMPPLCYWLYHKPVGIDCNNRPADPASLHHILKTLPQRVFAVGRLDKDSCGLLLLTNDGTLCQRLMHPDYHHTKTYVVTTDKALSTEFVHRMAKGVSWQLGSNHYQSRPCQIDAVGPQQFEIILTQGLHRQIRYMCKTLGYKVTALKRISIGALSIGELPSGHCRPLEPAEVIALLQ